MALSIRLTWARRPRGGARELDIARRDQHICPPPRPATAAAVVGLEGRGHFRSDYVLLIRTRFHSRRLPRLARAPGPPLAAGWPLPHCCPGPASHDGRRAAGTRAPPALGQCPGAPAPAARDARDFRDF